MSVTAVAAVLRFANLAGFDSLYDERLTLALVNNILRGNLTNNWKFADVPSQYQIDLYNFSAYFYVAAGFDIVARPFVGDDLYRARLLSALLSTAGIPLLFAAVRR